MESLSLEETIQSIFQQHHIQVPYALESTSSATQSYAAYNQEKDLIIIRPESLMKELTSMQQLGIEFQDRQFFEMIILHELGHAKDEKIAYYHTEKKRILTTLQAVTAVDELESTIEELGKIILESETNAWHYVERHMQTNEHYERYKDRCLRQYIAHLERMYELAKKRIS